MSRESKHRSPSGPLRRIAQLFGTPRTTVRRRKRDDFADFSDYLLKDIGLTRGVGGRDRLNRDDG